MKIRTAALLLTLATGATLGLAQTTQPAAAPATQPSTLKTETQRISYALGLQIGESLGGKLKGVDLDNAALAAGFNDAATGAQPQISEKEMQESMMALKQRVMGQSQADAAANQKAGDEYLAKNAKAEGVKTTASGLQYKVLKSGAGKTPKATDTVSVNYRGTLINGKEFDASRGKPVTFPVNGVIPGWTEALEMMKEGDKWQVTIPSKLAYGPEGAGGAIGPNETLVFEVELLKVEPADAGK